MAELTDRIYWDKVHENKEFLKYDPRESIGSSNILKRIYKILFYNYSSYSDFLLWEKIYKKFMPKTSGLKILEVGSAPGLFLVELSKKFNFDPYGVEFSRKGSVLNKEIFIQNNLNADNIIFADFFSKEFQNVYKEKFDIIISRGFIEHFTNIQKVIINHRNILKKGGLMFIIIPNFKGFNYKLLKFFNKESISKHNLDIMNKEKFRKIFKNLGIRECYINYCGTFFIGLFYTHRNSVKKLILNLCKKLQYFFDLIFLLIFKKRGLETRFFSPFLIFIGIKK